MTEYGPKLKISEEIHSSKYRGKGETFKEAMSRIAGELADSPEHYQAFRDALLNQRFLPAGRVQAAIGSPREVTAYNCFVSGTILDDSESIMDKAKEAFQTMRLGGGIGYDFSTLRPRGSRIKSLDSQSSGPLSFMDIYNSVCGTVSSAGHRRGAQMGVLRVDHPDIEEFIRVKQNSDRLTNFNLSVAVTDSFMEAVKVNGTFPLVFNNEVYKVIRARPLWEELMRSTWDWAEPGVLFIDTINKKNNLWYCETIAATNPCLHPDSMIETVNGRVRIADITEPTIVYTMNSDGSLGTAKASASWVSKRNAKTLRVKVRSGKEVICTPDHKIYVQNKGWIEAKNLEIGDQLVHLCRSRRGAAYSGVKLSTEDNRAYRMEHRFIAEAVHGPLSEDEDVHHIDGDTYNNNIDNFEILSHSEHSSLTRNNSPNNHQINGYYDNGLFGFQSTGRTPKKIIPMPEELRSGLKNNFSTCVSSIEEGPITDVYDLMVEGTHNFIADFIVVHNCGEQPLPPYGACLLGSFNIVKYAYCDEEGNWGFDYTQFKADIRSAVRAMDNIIDRTTYPLPQQEVEAKSKRRMGLGLTGVANCIETVWDTPYGTPAFLQALESILKVLRNVAYRTSIELAKEKGAFPLYDTKYLEGQFIRSLPQDIRDEISSFGIRNSHLLSIAPTGTISLTADNVSSSIEPVFTHRYTRTLRDFDGTRDEEVTDFAYREWGIKGRTADQVPPEDHVRVLNLASKYVDSAVSKTCNIGPSVTWEEFKNVYIQAYEGGASGCTTFRSAGKRYGILNTIDEPTGTGSSDVELSGEESSDGQACYFDPETGRRSCE